MTANAQIVQAKIDGVCISLYELVKSGITPGGGIVAGMLSSNPIFSAILRNTQAFSINSRLLVTVQYKSNAKRKSMSKNLRD